MQAKFDTLVLGDISAPGGDLRNVLELRFSVPRTPGMFNLTVFARDSAGCTTVTTAPRLVQIN